jgi:hypothetical protein
MTRKSVTKKPKVRHTHATLDGIEDTEADLINIISEMEIALVRAKQALGKLHLLRRGPHAYRSGRSKLPKITFIKDEDDQEK